MNTIKNQALSLQGKIGKLQRAIRKQTRPLQKRIRSIGTELSRMLHADLKARGLVLFDSSNSPGNICVGTRNDMRRFEERGGGTTFEVTGPIRVGKERYEIRIDGEWLPFRTPAGW